MLQLRPYQIEISNKTVDILRKYNIVYLALEVRTGKTLTALQTAELFEAKNVLFLTKKKAIESIQNDFDKGNFSFNLTIVNNESLHLLKKNDFDLLISDEHHRNGAFPKPNKMTKDIRVRFSRTPMIFLSGTPHPESFSQIYHQFWCSKYSPFEENNFYKWAKTYVNVKERNLGYAVVKDYSDGIKDLIYPKILKYMINFSQEDAGFETQVQEHILKVAMNPMTYLIAKRLLKDKYIKANDGRMVMADTAVKMMQKLHQIYSGTVIFEDGSSRLIDTTKADFIKKTFEFKKIAIFYKFKAELDILNITFGDQLTTDLTEFNKTDKNIALQIISGREGISLSKANCLVYYNIDFSATSYWQSRARLSTIDRKSEDIYWIFSEKGIEKQIYKTVLKKKNFTSIVFKNEFSKESNQAI
jgi:hypothetical protein